MRRLMAALVATLLATQLMAMPVAANNDTCSSGEVCFWAQANFTGTGMDFHDPATNDPDWNLFGMENDDDSVWNRESITVRVYAGWNYSEGVTYCTTPGESEDDINLSYDDNGDSNKLFSGSSCAGYPSP